MKIGDKLYCYNNITGNKKFNLTLNFTVGEYYEIYNIRKTYSGKLITIQNNRNSEELWNNITYDTKYSIYNYFLSIKQQRKLKLDKLNEYNEKL